MNRREFLHRASLIAAGAVAADQIELLDRLRWVRRFFPAWGTSGAPLRITSAEWDKVLREAYSADIVQAIKAAGPLLQAKRIPMRDRYIGTAEGWHYIEVVHA